MTGPVLTAHAHAKINLSLEVVGRRPDGFHELVSVMQTVTLRDTLEAVLSPEIRLTCTDPLLESDDNLVVRAARLVQKRFGVAAGCTIHLDKRIPVAAGLGGGSSDAAAALFLVTRLWNIDVERARLLPLAQELGSDVPFLLHGGTALVEGRGERVSPLPPTSPRWYVLSKPPMGVSTATVFRAMDSREWTDGTITRMLARDMCLHGEVRMGLNGLQETAFRLYPEIRPYFEQLASLAPDSTILSGSGPTIVAAFGSREEAEQARDRLPVSDAWTALAASYLPSEGELPWE